MSEWPLQAEPTLKETDGVSRRGQPFDEALQLYRVGGLRNAQQAAVPSLPGWCGLHRDRHPVPAECGGGRMTLHAITSIVFGFTTSISPSAIMTRAAMSFQPPAFAFLQSAAA